MLHDFWKNKAVPDKLRRVTWHKLMQHHQRNNFHIAHIEPDTAALFNLNAFRSSNFFRNASIPGEVTDWGCCSDFTENAVPRLWKRNNYCHFFPNNNLDLFISI